MTADRAEVDAAEIAEAQLVALADELCRKAHDADRAGHCQECYGVAAEVVDTEWLDARVAAAANNARGEVLDEVERRLAETAGVEASCRRVVREVRAARSGETA